MKIITKQANIPTVFPKNTMASRFLFSMKRKIGSEKNKNPITAAESTKRDSITMGMTMVSPGIMVVILLIKKTISTIYSAAARA